MREQDFMTSPLSRKRRLSLFSQINYFGRAEAADEIVVKPVLITKGQTKVRPTPLPLSVVGCLLVSRRE